MLTLSIIAMITALICYSVGVWGEKITGRLNLFNVILFWTGFLFDTAGTVVMGIISGVFKINIHGVTACWPLS